MKIRILLCSLALALTVGPALRAADDQTELGGKMEKINAAYRKLRTQVSDASKNEDSLAQAAIIKENATAALKLKPPMVNVPADQQQKYVAGYQDEIKKLIDAVGQLEAELKAGKNEEAAKTYAVLGAIQKEGHTTYRPKKQ